MPTTGNDMKAKLSRKAAREEREKLAKKHRDELREERELGFYLNRRHSSSDTDMLPDSQEWYAEYQKNALARLHADATRFIPSGSPVVVPKKRIATKYKPGSEKAKREARAQELSNQRKKRVAIQYNKGPYMYISDDADPKDFGKK